MFARPTAPLSVGGVIDASLRLFTGAFRAWWLPSFVGALLGRLPVLFIVLIATPRAGQAPRNAAAALAAFAESPTFWLGYLAIILISIWTHMSIVVSLNRAYVGEPLGAGASMAKGLRFTPRALLAGILTGLALVGGFALLIIPGLWLMGRMYFQSAAMVHEDIGALASMRRSYALTRGHWWRSFAIVMVSLVILIIVTFGVGFISSLALLPFSAHPLAVVIVQQSIAVVTGTLIAPILPATIVAAYHDLLLRREGGDLEARVGGLSAT